MLQHNNRQWHSILSATSKIILTLSVTSTSVLPSISWAQSLDPVKVQLDWVATGDKAFLYAGVKEGIYKKAGLDVTISQGRGAPEAVTQVAAGNADVAAVGINALMQAAAEEKTPVKAVMSIYSKPPEAVFTYEGSGVTELRSAMGKRMAYSMTTAPWPGVLRKEKLDPNGTSMINVSPTTLDPMLASGRADMILSWVTKQADAEDVMNKAGRKLKVLPLSDYGLQGYAYSLVASQRMIDSRPDVLKRFVSATQDAVKFAIEHPEQTTQDLASSIPETETSIAERQLKDSFALIDNEISRSDGFGAFNQALLATTWQWVADSYDLPQNAINPEDVVDRRFMTPIKLH